MHPCVTSCSFSLICQQLGRNVNGIWNHWMQALANPNYLNWLAQNRYFEDPAFIKYLDYLHYFQRREYVTYIKCAPNLQCIACCGCPQITTAKPEVDSPIAVGWLCRMDAQDTLSRNVALLCTLLEPEAPVMEKNHSPFLKRPPSSASFFKIN